MRDRQLTNHIVSSRAVTEELREVSKRFTFTEHETRRIYLAYKQICNGFAREAMHFTQFIEETYRYMNASEVSYGKKCSLSFWLDMTPGYIEASEDLESINPDAPFQPQTVWIQEQWDSQTKDSLVHVQILSLLRRRPHPAIIPRRGRHGKDNGSGEERGSAAAPKYRPKRHGSGKPCKLLVENDCSFCSTV